MQIRGTARSIVMFGALSAGPASLLAGCASVTAIPVEADGLNAVPGAQPGFRYFLPRPYLLVAEAPAAKTVGGSKASSSQTSKPMCMIPGQAGLVPCGVARAAAAEEKKKKDAAAEEKKKKDAAAGADNKEDVGASAPSKPAPATTPAASPSTSSTASNGTDGGDSKPAAGSPSDTSFQVGDGKTYIAKLIYLPDYSRPMAVELNTGLVGISKVDLTLQDGWMLTYVSANADNSKMADVLTAAIQAISTSASGGATKAASKAASGTVGAAAPTQGKGAAPRNPALRPGLYAFDYNYGMSRVSGICAVSFFDSNGIMTPARGEGACGPDYSRPMPPPVSALY
jgi:hypothetical protein